MEWRKLKVTISRNSPVITEEWGEILTGDELKEQEMKHEEYISYLVEKLFKMGKNGELGLNTKDDNTERMPLVKRFCLDTLKNYRFSKQNSRSINAQNPYIFYR